ncbi:hypothetical protein ACFWMP_31425 [Paenibacillus sp. NPDC058367]|uniref:hypothetical protein n=1 Tax=Paenibacillus sp. NPDC058367 TaxID=3346460 RepID=UPI003654C837
MGSDKSIENADQEMIHIRELEKYIPADYRDSIMNIIRLQLIEAYRKGWKDSEKYFDEK